MSRPRNQSPKNAHNYALNRLSPYMDGELRDRERALVQAHLNACPDCRAAFRSLRWTRELLQQVPALPVPRSFIVREADLEARSAMRPLGRLSRSLAGLQTATAVVAILLVLVVAGDLFVGRSLPLDRAAPAISMRSEDTEADNVAVLAAPEQMQLQPTAEQEEAAPKAQPEMGMLVINETATLSPTTTAAPTPAGALAEGASTKRSPTSTLQPEPTDTSERAPEPPAEPRSTSDPQRVVAIPASSTPELAESEEYEGVIPIPTTLTPERLRMGWRVAQVGLGVLLVGLLVAILLLRLKSRAV